MPDAREPAPDIGRNSRRLAAAPIRVEDAAGPESRHPHPDERLAFRVPDVDLVRQDPTRLVGKNKIGAVGHEIFIPETVDLLGEPDERRESSDRHAGGDGRRRNGQAQRPREYRRIDPADRQAFDRLIVKEAGIRRRGIISRNSLGRECPFAKAGLVVIAVEAPVTTVGCAPQGQRRAIVRRRNDTQRAGKGAVGVDLARVAAIDKRQMHPVADEAGNVQNRFFSRIAVDKDVLGIVAMHLLPPAACNAGAAARKEPVPTFGGRHPEKPAGGERIAQPQRILVRDRQIRPHIDTVFAGTAVLARQTDSPVVNADVLCGQGARRRRVKAVAGGVGNDAAGLFHVPDARKRAPCFVSGDRMGKTGIGVIHADLRAVGKRRNLDPDKRLSKFVPRIDLMRQQISVGIHKSDIAAFFLLKIKIGKAVDRRRKPDKRLKTGQLDLGRKGLRDDGHFEHFREP